MDLQKWKNPMIHFPSKGMKLIKLKAQLQREIALHTLRKYGILEGLQPLQPISCTRIMEQRILMGRGFPRQIPIKV